MIDSDIGHIAPQAVESVQRNGATDATDGRTHRDRIHVRKGVGGCDLLAAIGIFKELPGVLGMR